MINTSMINTSIINTRTRAGRHRPDCARSRFQHEQSGSNVRRVARRHRRINLAAIFVGTDLGHGNAWMTNAIVQALRSNHVPKRNRAR